MNACTNTFLIVFLLHAFLCQEALGFVPIHGGRRTITRTCTPKTLRFDPTTIRTLPVRVRLQSSTTLSMAQITEAQAKKGIDKVVSALKRDSKANTELGKLIKVNNILGYGSPKAGIIAVRFNASFQKGGKGLSSVPLPFGLGQSNVSEGRGTMVGQVKASLDEKSGKIVDCSVFRDLGYGRAFNLKV